MGGIILSDGMIAANSAAQISKNNDSRS